MRVAGTWSGRGAARPSTSSPPRPGTGRRSSAVTSNIRGSCACAATTPSPRGSLQSFFGREERERNKNLSSKDYSGFVKLVNILIQRQDG